MDILDPAGLATIASRRLAPRPARVARGVLGILDNSKPNARALLDGVASELRLRWQAREVRVWRKPSSSHGASPAVLDEIAAACGAVLTASAD